MERKKRNKIQVNYSLVLKKKIPNFRISTFFIHTFVYPFLPSFHSLVPKPTLHANKNISFGH